MRSHGWHVGSRIARGACRVRLLAPALEGALGWWSPQGFRVDRLLIGNFGRCFLHGLGSEVLIPMLLVLSTSKLRVCTRRVWKVRAADPWATAVPAEQQSGRKARSPAWAFWEFRWLEF